MFLFLYGKDTYRSREQLKKMIAKFKTERDPAGYNVTQLDVTTEKNPGRIVEELLALPFLAEKRLVVVENLLASKHKDLQEQILKRIAESRLPESTIAIFWEATDAYKTKEAKALFAVLEKEKFAQKFDVLSGAQLVGWIAARTKELGGTISSAAVQFVAMHVGDDTWAEASLLAQLVAYVGSREIVPADVRLFLSETADDSIFNLVDAIVAGQAKSAFAMIAEQYRIGEDVQFIFAMLLRQFRILLELRDLTDRSAGMPSDIIAKQLNLHPFVVKKSLPMVKRYSFAKLRQIYMHLLDLDIGIKTGQGNPETLLDIFVGRLSISS